jgi:AmmeMemoRadiSam system protein B
MTDFLRELPRLRMIDASPFTYEGAQYLLLRDPLGLTDKTLLIPQPMIPVVMLADGTRTPSTIRSALVMRYGIFLPALRIEEMLEALDDALLLDNSHSRQARAQVQAEFRQAPFRTPASAGATYPDDPNELEEYLQGFLNQVNGNGQSAAGAVRGIISPHIDYQRGGPIYAHVWSQAAEAARAADLAIIFGTDHYSEGRPISLTRQHYATPFGVLPTETRIVDALADAIGVEEAFAGELHHRREHSIELAAVWLHYVGGKRPIHLVPILTGSVSRGENRAPFDTILRVLREETRGRNVIVVAAGDLAHVGPAFDTSPVDPDTLVLLKDADDELIRAMCEGSAGDFLGAIERVEDCNNVCGVSPIYMTLSLLESTRGHSHGYATCPADQNNTSVVTICGVTLQ